MADKKPLKWSDVWRLARDPESPAGTRAFRETSIVLGVALSPLLLGTFLAWVGDRQDGAAELPFYHYLYYGVLGGQLFLVFLSLAGTNFSRLWDPQAPKIEFSGWTNGLALGGAILTGGLLGMDSTMSGFAFFPVNLLSVALFALSIVHYFFLAVPTYIEGTDTSDRSRRAGDQMADELDQVPMP